MFRLITYGTLRPGCAMSRNISPLLKFGEVITDVSISNLRMYVLGGAPAAVFSSDLNDTIVGDIIECEMTPRQEFLWKLMLNAMEGFPQTGYVPKTIGTARGPALVYVYVNSIPRNAIRITDWKAWEKKFAAMSPEERAAVLGDTARIQLVSAEGAHCGY